MKIASWNVNSVRARLPLVLRWLGERAPEVLLLQETKSTDDKFPFAEFAEIGYHAEHYGQPSYNGVAIVSKLPLSDVVRAMPARRDDGEARVIAATVSPPCGEMRVLSVYVPNGQTVSSEKYQYKLEWLADFCRYLADSRRRWPRVLAGGDYNIAPANEDIYDAADWGEGVLASPPERAAFAALLEAGFCDAHRLFPQPLKIFSWWDYRAAAYRRNRGLRIDLILLSQPLSRWCIACAPDAAPRGWEKPSDHAPVTAVLAAEVQGAL